MIEIVGLDDILISAQIGNVPSSLRIVDYSHGMTGSVHDALSFENTGAYKYPDWFFEPGEFAWGDSAYAVSPRMIPVHKKPAADLPHNALFDTTLARLRVRSEHCMGALKGRFQCLRGLRAEVNDQEGHVSAMKWISVAIILHNLIIDVEGDEAEEFADLHTREDEVIDRAQGEVPIEAIDSNAEGEVLRQKLVAEIVAYKTDNM